MIFASAAVTALALLFVSAPYGRHARAGWGPALPPRLGWVLMESPAVLAFGLAYATGAHAAEPAPLLLMGAWMLHYVYRSVLFPRRLDPKGRTMPLSIAGLGALYNLLNGVVNGRQVGQLGDYAGWLVDPRLWLGLLVFALGMALNRQADATLLRLRAGCAPGEYTLPQGGLFRWVSCPNYLGELLEWTGWAIATWSLAGLSFAVFTAANLVPRALSHHRWYQERFPDYPPERKAILPLLL